MESIQNLREQRTKAATAARQLLDNNADWSQDNQQQYDGIMSDIEQIDAKIDRVQKVLDVEASNAARTKDRASRDNISEDHAAHNVEMEKSIFNTWMRSGKDALNSAQRDFIDQKRQSVKNAMSTTTDAEGGYLVPEDFAAQLLKEMKDYGGVRGVANVISTDSGNVIEFPTSDETSAEGEILAENAETTRADVTFGMKQIGAYKFSSKDIAVPIELLQDSKIDIEAHVRGALVERIARITNRLFTTGTGTGQPTGIVTASSLGKTGATGQVDSVTHDDIIDLIHSIDPAYRRSGRCGFMFHDSTLKVLRKLKDADGRPLWQPSIQVGEPDRLDNFTYTINQNMPEMEAGAKSILFGDFNKYMIRDVMAVQLFRMTDSVFTRKGQIGFMALSRHDAALMDAGGQSVKHYINAAS